MVVSASENDVQPLAGLWMCGGRNMLQIGNPYRDSAEQPAAIIHQQHPNEAIEHRLKEIDEDIRHLEPILRRDLAFRGLLRLCSPAHLKACAPPLCCNCMRPKRLSPALEESSSQ